MVGSHKYTSASTSSTRCLALVEQRVLQAALAPATRKFYEKHLQRFCEFVSTYHTGHCWPESPVHPNVLANFIAFLTLKNDAPSTVTSNISAISYAHKIKGWADPSDSFLVKKLLTGAKNLHGSLDMRLPITRSVLSKLITAVVAAVDSLYIQRLLQAMFSLAFFGLLTVAEMTTRNNNPSSMLEVI